MLTLQKLVHLEEPSSYDSDSEEDDVASVKSVGTNATKKIRRRFNKLFPSRAKNPVLKPVGGTVESSLENGYFEKGGAGPAGQALRSELTQSSLVSDLGMRTLQRYHASPNDARTEYMETHSALADQNLAVAAEQVSMFITNDNTVISFFETSATDIERPILTRLAVSDTVLRSSCDASM